MNKGCKRLHLGSIRIELQPLFLGGKNVICFTLIFDTRWQLSEKTLISAMEVGLNQEHVIIQVKLNFTLDLHKPTLPRNHQSLNPVKWINHAIR